MKMGSQSTSLMPPLERTLSAYISTDLIADG